MTVTGTAEAERTGRARTVGKVRAGKIRTGKVRILWVSKHPPLQKQLQELERIFGSYDLHQYSGFVKDAEHVIELMRIYEADEVVTILPLTMIWHLVEKHGIYPIYPEMEQVNNTANVNVNADADADADADARTNVSGAVTDADYVDHKSGRCYKFKKFVRIKGFNLVKEEL